MVTRARAWGGFLVACVVGLLFEHAQAISDSVLGAETIYQRAISTGFRAAIPRYTAVVMINDGIEPQEVTLANACEQRAFLATLLKDIGAAKPDAIVIDKFFSSRLCRSSPSGTDALLAVIKDLQDGNTPVVVGRHVDNAGTLNANIPFDGGGYGPVKQGALAMHEDLRRVALRWTDLKEPDGTAVPTIDTISLSAALARNPLLLKQNGRSARFYERGEAPFAGMLPADAYNGLTLSAIKIVCGPSGGTTSDWRQCNNPDSGLIRQLHGRIVMIGEDSFGIDSHVSNIGDVPGVLLHSVYVEAILDDDLFTPIPSAVTYGYGFIIFVALKALIKRSPKHVAILAVSGVATSYVVTFVLARFGYYLNPGVGLFALLVSKLAEHVEGRIQTAAGDIAPSTGASVRD